MQQGAGLTGLDAFLRQRPRLLALAYRMLGATGEAEDTVQEAWLRWQAADQSGIAEPAAWLATVVTRLCLDRLRRMAAARRDYPGPWLPEPWLAELPAPAETAPDRRLDRAADLSIAFLLLLERLSPMERAALLLRDAFGADYATIAAALGRSEAACRQILHRARARLRDAAPRPPATPPTPPTAHRRLLGAFLAAARSGDPARLLRLLAEDASCLTDGGGKVRAALNPILGADRVARFVVGVARRLPAGLEVRPLVLNGQPGLGITLAGEPWGVPGAGGGGGAHPLGLSAAQPGQAGRPEFLLAAVTARRGTASWVCRVAMPPAKPRG